MSPFSRSHTHLFHFVADPKNFTFNADEIVLDPFGGSGTTLAVAKKLGRRWIGFELSADYVAKIKDRLHETRVGAPLDGAADPLTSAPPTPHVPRTRSAQRRRTQ
jgi:hypothetical protein